MDYDTIVRISGSTYEVNLDEEPDGMWLRRFPKSADPMPGAPNSKLLRRDAERIRILGIERLVVGERAEFRLESLSEDPDVLFTHRSTTEVVEITRLR